MHIIDRNEMCMQNFVFAIGDENVMDVKTIDFGLATQGVDGLRRHNDIVRGTIGFIAPEAQENAQGHVYADCGVDSFAVALVSLCICLPKDHIKVLDPPTKDTKPGEKVCTCAALHSKVPQEESQAHTCSVFGQAATHLLQVCYISDMCPMH